MTSLPEALKYFKRPFRYENIGQTIYAGPVEDSAMALQVRGWGHLTGGAAEALPPEQAAKMQDEFGAWVAGVLNEASIPFGREPERRAFDTLWIIECQPGNPYVTYRDRHHRGDGEGFNRVICSTHRIGPFKTYQECCEYLVENAKQHFSYKIQTETSAGTRD